MGVGRLAPSPTGAQHLGNARTFLLAYWSARASGSRLILRIEDIDSPRIKSWAAQQAIDDLRWLGIDWDEGPDIGGPHAPYVQTQRLGLYASALKQLIALELAYPCTCTRKDLETSGSAPHFENEGKVYPGTCAGWRNGDPLPGEGSYCWRFRVGQQAISFNDAVARRQQCIPTRQLGDFPITQKNGSPSYQLAVVVDDGEMGITEVVRGNDLIPSTFRQIELFAALGYPVPSFAHVPLVVGPDGKRLAKRHGDTRLSELREQGVSPQEIIDWVMKTCQIEAHAGKQKNQKIRFNWSQIPRDSVILVSGCKILDFKR